MAEGQGQGQEQPKQPGLIATCCACLCCLALCPLICCCAASHTAVQKAQGKRWDAKQHKWVVDNLETEGKELENVPEDDDDILKMAKEAEEGASKVDPEAAGKVKETDYYEALGVSPDADEHTIKRAYYVNARKWHPDKNDSDEAKEKFQKIGEAYQVLSDEKLRKQYDKEGKDGLSGDRTEVAPDSLDPSLVFTMLFGSDAFEDIIGRLALVTMTMAGNPEETKITQKDIQEIERRRVVRLALKLVKRIQKHVDGDYSHAKEEWTAEGKKLVEVRYGEEILNTVGATYKLVGTQIIGSWGESANAQVAEHEMKVGAAKKAQKGAEEMQKDQSGEGDGSDQLPHYLEMMWNVTVIDISSTLREVVMKVCKDQSKKDAERKKRAEAIVELGKIWEELKSEKADGKQRSARTLYQSAAQAALEKNIEKMRKEEETNMADLD